MTYREFDAFTRLHFSLFVERIFAELNPGVEYLDNFHIHILCNGLEDMREGRNTRLAVAMPPHSLKSIIISVAWIAWLIGYDPTLKIICVSYGQELADKLAIDCWQIMQAAWYQCLFPLTILQQLKEELGLDHFEGRSWTGLHRHALMSMMAYAFLQSRRLAQAGRKKESSARLLNPACQQCARPSLTASSAHRRIIALTADAVSQAIPAHFCQSSARMPLCVLRICRNIMRSIWPSPCRHANLEKPEKVLLARI